MCDPVIKRAMRSIGFVTSNWKGYGPVGYPSVIRSWGY